MRGVFRHPSPGAVAAGKRNRWRAVLLALGCALFGYLVLRIGLREVVRPLVEIGWYFAVITAVYLCWEVVRALAYRECIAVSGSCPLWDALRFRLSGEAIQFLTSTGPFLAEPAKMWLLRQRGFNVKQAVAATLTEYLLYTFSSALLAVAGLACLLANFPLSRGVADSAKALLIGTGVFLAVAACAIAGRIYLIGTILKWFRSVPWAGRRLSFADQDLRETEDLLFVVLRDRPLRFLSIMALEFAAQGLLILELFVLLAATKESFSIYTSFLIEGATKFIGFAFFFIPGQVGAAEGTYALIFKAIGLPGSAGFALAVARRLRSLLVAGVGLALAPSWRARSAPRAPR